ncbi:MAG: TatD family hydrolase [Gemmatimonadetes bacterium]|nr:TatD family hydrolase [Gemmatimonadota bacterium]
MLFDSHCHLTDARFDADRAEVLARARDAGVVALVTVGSDARDSEAAARLAEAEAAVWATAGIHPHEAASASERDLHTIRDLAGSPRVVAIGETGLDYHYEHSPRHVQRRFFSRHLELALELALPVVVHSRSADQDTAAVLRDVGAGTRGVLHCFTGGEALLDAALEAAWYISFSGLISFKGFAGEALVRRVPGDRILIETDAPYLAPVPWRGRRNEPAYVRHVCDALAAQRGEDAAELAVRTTENARRFYNLTD